MNILIIEDNKDLLELLQGLLTEKGHTVTCKDNYVDALHYIRDEKQARTNLVLMDFILKGASSEPLVDVIREKAPGAHVVVMSAGIAEKEDILGALYQQKKIDAVLEKPFEFKSLLALIGRYDTPPSLTG